LTSTPQLIDFSVYTTAMNQDQHALYTFVKIHLDGVFGRHNDVVSRLTKKCIFVTDTVDKEKSQKIYQVYQDFYHTSIREKIRLEKKIYRLCCLLTKEKVDLERVYNYITEYIKFIQRRFDVLDDSIADIHDFRMVEIDYYEEYDDITNNVFIVDCYPMKCLKKHIGVLINRIK